MHAPRMQQVGCHQWLPCFGMCSIVMAPSPPPHYAEQQLLLAAVSHLPTCLSMSSIFVWNTGSTASTLTPVPLCGIANTSTTCTK